MLAYCLLLLIRQYMKIMDPRMDTGMLTDGDDKIDVAVHDSNSTMLLSHQDLSRALDRLLLYEVREIFPAINILKKHT